LLIQKRYPRLGFEGNIPIQDDLEDTEAGTMESYDYSVNPKASILKDVIPINI